MRNLIKTPSVDEVEKYLEIWKTKPKYEKYRQQEKSVVMLFKQYPENTKIEEVLVKVSVLNKFYSTGIPDILELSVAQNIVDLKIDNNLANADLDIIEKIARVNEKSKRYYSFATKYCFHHRPDVYPICDRLVREGLKYFRNKEKFYKFKNDDLMCYKTFKTVFYTFIEHFKLERFCLRKLDLYLWVLGKEKFEDNNN